MQGRGEYRAGRGPNRIENPIDRGAHRAGMRELGWVCVPDGRGRGNFRTIYRPVRQARSTIAPKNSRPINPD